MDIHTINAIRWKYPNIEMTVLGDEITFWKSNENKPDDKMIFLIVAEYDKYLERVRYKKYRASEYPPIEEQLDAIFKGGSDFEQMKERIQAIKDKYPKPQENING